MIENAGESRGRLAWESLAVMGCMIALAAVAACLVRAAGDPYPINATRAPLPWVPFGLAVAVLYFRGQNRWPGVLAGAIGGGLVVGGIPPAAAVLQGISATVFAGAIRALLRAWRVNPALERWQDPLLLWLAAALGATVMGCIAATAVLGVAGLQLDHAGHGMVRALLDAGGRPIFQRPLFVFAACWIANWSSGVALVIPASGLLRRATWRNLRGRFPELWSIALVLIGWAIAAFLPLPWVASLPLFLVALILVTWSAIRFGAAVAAVIPLALALIESAAFIDGRGPLATRPEDAIAVVWTFILVISVLGMLITSLLAERDAAYRRQVTSEKRYRVLFESSPRALWVYDPSDLRVLMVNEAATRLYGYTRAEFADLRVSTVDSRDLPGTAAPDAATAELDKGEHRHRTRGGAIIEVELHAEPIEFDGRPARLVFSDDVTDRNRLRGALLDAADRAERKLGRELHDGLGQDLLALSLLARAETARVSKGGALELRNLALMESVALGAVASCRAIARGLSALAENGGDLSAALQRLPDRFQHSGPPAISVTIKAGEPSALPEEAKDHIYRIAQEALTNAVRHAGADRIDLILAATDRTVALIVRDDGIGLPDGSVPSGGLGWASMRHRASAIGALLHAGNSNGGGTEVRLEYEYVTAARVDRPH